MEHDDRTYSGFPDSEQRAEDWTKSRMRGVADATRQRFDEAKQGAKDYASEAKEYVQGSIQQTREYVEGTVQHAHDKMTEYREGGMESVKQDLTSYTREQPMTALLIAAGAGMIIGWLSTAGRR